MYESFYGLSTKPFSMLPDPAFLYLSKKHQMALTLLEYGLMNHAGFCVISGEIGAGKTTLLRKLLDNMEESITVGMITNTHQSFGELLDWVLSAFGVHEANLNKVEMHQRLVEFLLEQYAKNKTTLLIVDEAQNMSVAALEELRMLSNINSEKDQVLQVILSGQPELKAKLQLPELSQFAQRIAVDFHIDALNKQETSGYIQHRLVTAGAKNDIFTPAACELINAYSGGIPRIINLICDTAMVYGFADQASTIDAPLVEQMVHERMENSVVPLLDLEAGRKYQLGEPDNSEFPWINPNGGTRGIKPDRNHEKKTVEAGQHVKRPSEKKAVSETSPPSHDDPETTPANPEPRDVEPQAAESPVTEPGPETGDIDETPAAAEDEAAPEIQGEAADDTGLASVDEEQKRQDGVSGQDDVQYEYIPQDESEPPQHPVRVIEAREPNMLNRRTLLVSLAAIIIAVLLSIMIGTYSSEPALTEDVKNKLVEAERIKQELAKMQELQQQQYREMQKQAEELKREREAAKALAELEEQKRAEEAASKEREAIEAAALAAEKALKAAQQAEKLARQQQLEDKRLKAELSRIEKERKKAELEKQQLEIKRQQAELEKQRLERERLAAERKARVQWEEAAAREQEALVETAQPEKKPATETAPTKETSFSTDPCSSPSAKFLSTCR